jgi:hypothetical protein
MSERLSERIDKGAKRSQALSEAIAAERWERQKEVKAGVEETEQSLASMLGTLEERILARPGKLPVVKTWKPETIAYQPEFVSHET